MNNINEEIERIKSLFSDNRLYGNLVNEACTEREAKDKLKSLNYGVFKKGETGSGCDIDSITHLKCVNRLLLAAGIPAGDITIFKDKATYGGCVIVVEKKIKSLAGHAQLKGDMILAFYQKGNFKFKDKTFALRVTFDDEFNSRSIKDVSGDLLEDISQYTYRGYYGDDCKNLKMFLVDAIHGGSDKVKTEEITNAKTVEQLIKLIVF